MSLVKLSKEKKKSTVTAGNAAATGLGLAGVGFHSASNAGIDMNKADILNTYGKEYGEDVIKSAKKFNGKARFAAGLLAAGGVGSMINNNRKKNKGK